MADANTSVFAQNSRILFRDSLNPAMTFTGQVIGLQILLEGDGCDLYFDLDKLDIVELIEGD
jgi:hypothetical protein